MAVKLNIYSHVYILNITPGGSYMTTVYYIKHCEVDECKHLTIQTFVNEYPILSCNVL